jgi:hypothetical protein
MGVDGWGVDGFEFWVLSGGRGRKREEGKFGGAIMA